jgi:histidinol-phosphate phosphatase family protein
MEIQAVILAGGKGTRLSEVSGGLPKPLVPVCGISVLEHAIIRCAEHGITELLVLVYHMSDQIEEAIGDGQRFGVCITYVREHDQRGTFGALLDAIEFLKDEFLVIYADTVFDIDLKQFVKTFQERKDRTGASAQIFLHPNNHPHDSDLVEIDHSKLVKRIHPYPREHKPQIRNLVNAALYILSKKDLLNVPEYFHSGIFDIAKHFFPWCIDNRVPILGYVSTEYIKDMGTPDRLSRVELAISEGVLEKLARRSKKTAVFLDRDGTLIRLIPYLNKIEQIQLENGVTSALRKLNDSGFLSVIATNQPVVARGDLSLKQLDEIHAEIEQLIGVNGAYIDGIYYCPHHPEGGHVGEIRELKYKCDCRKPEVGLLKKASSDLDIDLCRSWMIGDSSCDISAGNNAGCATILIEQGSKGLDKPLIHFPDFAFANLEEASNFIVSDYPMLKRFFLKNLSRIVSRKRVLISGLSRSGKTTAASSLIRVLSELGFSAKLISLDSWLLDRSVRMKKTRFEERFDIVGMESILRTLEADSGVTYCRQYRRHPFSSEIGITVDQTIYNSEVVVVEGVACSLLDPSLLAPYLHFYVETDPEVRKARLTRKYINLGFNTEEIDRTVLQRACDEDRTVEKLKSNADGVLKC